MPESSVFFDVPFRVATGDPDRCYEAATQSVLEYFYPGIPVTLEILDQLIGRKPGMWTWTCQIPPVLDRLGVGVKYFTPEDLNRQSSQSALVDLLKETYTGPGEFERVKDKTDFSVVPGRAQECIAGGLYVRERLTWPGIEARMQAGAVPMVLLDYNVLAQRRGPYQGHFVVVTGYDSLSVTYHENSERVAQPNRKVPKEIFSRAWDLDTTGRDTVLAEGRNGKGELERAALATQ